jgi:hypothetical protein
MGRPMLAIRLPCVGIAAGHVSPSEQTIEHMAANGQSCNGLTLSLTLRSF